MDKSSIVVWGVVTVFVALLGGYVADAMTLVASEDMKPGCHTDYYLWVVPVSAYCADHGNVTSENNPSETVWKSERGRSMTYAPEHGKGLFDRPIR